MIFWDLFISCSKLQNVHEMARRKHGFCERKKNGEGGMMDMQWKYCSIQTRGVEQGRVGDDVALEMRLEGTRGFFDVGYDFP